MRQQILELLEKRLGQCVSGKRVASSIVDEKMTRKRELCEKRGAEIVHVKASGKLNHRQEDSPDTENVGYALYVQYFIKQRDFFYIEEEIEHRMGVFYKGILIEDKEAPLPRQHVNQEIPLTQHPPMYEHRDIRYTYDRLKAVQYAETWWDSYNPAYQNFEVDCTNYISQCVHEGGAPMRGYPNRNNGWWMQNNNWSYSWAVANAFPKYLATSTAGLRAKEVKSALELKLGDVICYDFEGDGIFNHTTIVTAMDANNEPLVNAHTYNSRMRYWAYEDSSAYTPNIIYKFFTIVDG